MIIFEVSNPIVINSMTPIEPFIFKTIIDGYDLASFWVDDFGFPDESRVGNTTNINEVNQGYSIIYQQLFSYENCVLVEGSFYYDTINQFLYIHINHDVSPLTEVFQYSTSIGFTDSRLIYINDTVYLPLVKSIPSIAQQRDIINYRKPSYINGNVQIENNGRLDYLLTDDIIGNTSRIYYLDDTKVINEGDSTAIPAGFADIGALSPEGNFIFTSKPGAKQLASFWVDDFGFPDESSTTYINVEAFVRGELAIYTKVNTLIDCQSAEASFFWDYATQLLYVHMEHDQSPLTGDYQYSENSLSVGNPDTVSRSELEPLAEFYIEDFIGAQDQITFKVQDKRKNEDADVPNMFFDITNYPDIDSQLDQTIPLLFGVVREATAIITNDSIMSGNVSYRVAYTLTTLGTVQVYQDEIWTTKTAINISLTTGEFELSGTDGRNANGSIRLCRVLSPEGIEINYTSDIIKWLNEFYLEKPFNGTFYNTSEWGTEELNLTTGGMLIEKNTTVSNIIHEIQNKSVIGFRYEIQADGKRTIRIDDPDRAVSDTVDNNVIKNRNSMPFYTDAKIQKSEVIVEYDKSYNSGRYLRVKNDLYKNTIKNKNKNNSTLTVETILNNKTNADTRALNDVTRFKNIPKIINLNLMGSKFLFKRIFDTMNLVLTPDFADLDNLTITKEPIIVSNDILIDDDSSNLIDDDNGILISDTKYRPSNGRDYLGFWKAKVIKINPNIKNKENMISFELLEELTL